jgi:transcriptional regulator GlxA family with amidase domain
VPSIAERRAAGRLAAAETDLAVLTRDAFRRDEGAKLVVAVVEGLLGGVARTARVQRAKRLIDGTDLPMTAVAAEAGFASLRSFNAAIRQTYRRAPTELRRRRRGTVTPAAASPSG